MLVFSLLDRKLKEYGPLVQMNSPEAVKRGLADTLRAGKAGLIGEHPEDFDLMWIGEFDVETGVLVPAKVPTLVVNAAELIPARGDNAEDR